MPCGLRHDEARSKEHDHGGSPALTLGGSPRARAGDGLARDHSADEEHQRQGDVKGDGVADLTGCCGHSSAYESDQEGRPASGTDEGGNAEHEGKEGDE